MKVIFNETLNHRVRMLDGQRQGVVLDVSGDLPQPQLSERRKINRRCSINVQGYQPV